MSKDDVLLKYLGVLDNSLQCVLRRLGENKSCHELWLARQAFTANFVTPDVAEKPVKIAPKRRGRQKKVAADVAVDIGSPNEIEDVI